MARQVAGAGSTGAAAPWGPSRARAAAASSIDPYPHGAVDDCGVPSVWVHQHRQRVGPGRPPFAVAVVPIAVAATIHGCVARSSVPCAACDAGCGTWTSRPKLPGFARPEPRCSACLASQRSADPHLGAPAAFVSTWADRRDRLRPLFACRRRLQPTSYPVSARKRSIMFSMSRAVEALRSR